VHSQPLDEIISVSAHPQTDPMRPVLLLMYHRKNPPHLTPVPVPLQEV
jgi:hypothetical protein